MNRSILSYKRATAVILCLALICGVIMGVRFWPLTLSAEGGAMGLTGGAKKFTANFSTMTDTATQETDLEALFDFYHVCEKNFIGPIDSPFLSSADCGISNWRTAQLSLDGNWLKQAVNYDSGETFRQGFSFVPKGNAAVKNFAATFDVSLDDYAKSAITLSFRSDTAGKVNNTVNREGYANQDMLILNNAGYQLVSAGAFGGTADVYTLPTYTKWNGNAVATTATVSVRVVGKNVALKVTSGDTVYCDTTLELAEDRAAGSLYFALMAGNEGIGNIEITNLDASGNAINWDGTVANATFKSDFTTLADTTAQAAALNELFTFYHVCEKTLKGPIDSPFLTSADLGITNWRQTWLTLDGEWLRQNNNYVSTEAFRQGYSFSPKGSGAIKNFEASFKISLEADKPKAAVALSFRSDTEGKINNNINREVYTNQDMLILGTGGYQLVSAAGFGGTADVYTLPNYTKWDDDASVTTATVSVKVVGKTVTLKVTGTGTTVYCEETLELAADRDAGALCFALMSGKVGIADITVTKLDAVGVPVGWDGVAVNATGLAADFATLTDAATQATDMKALFDVYHVCEKTLLGPVDTPFAASGDLGISNWRSAQLSIDGNWLKQTVNYDSGETFRQGFSLVPKNSGNVKNFETSFTVQLDDYAISAITLSFRSDTAGKVNNTINREGYANQDMLILNNAGYQLVSAGAFGGTADVYTLPSYTKWNGDAVAATATVYVKVVGKAVTLKVTNGDTVYCDTTLELAADRDAGIMYYAMMSGNSAIADVTINKVDENGTVVNWDGTPVASASKFSADFGAITEADVASDIAALKSAFNFYHVCEKNFIGPIDSPFLSSADCGISNWRTAQLSVDGKWLKQTVNYDSDETFRQGFSFAPKGQNNNIKNFEATFEVSFDDYAKSAITLSFRSDTEGKVDNTINREVYTNQDMLILNNAGYQLVSAGKFGGTADVYTLPSYTKWSGDAVATTATVSVKAVGKEVTLKVTSGSTVYCDTVLHLEEDRAAGALFFALMSGNEAIANIVVKQLNSNGELMSFGTVENTGSANNGYDSETTAVYTFDDAAALDSFETWFMPTTNVKDQSAVHAESADWVPFSVEGGKLTYKKQTAHPSVDAIKTGVDIGGTTYKDTAANGYTTNHGIAVLKVKEYKNFILEVDVNSNSRWSLIGFGANDYADATSVFPTHTNGGYTFHVESGNGVGTAYLWGNATRMTKTVMEPYVIDGKSHHYTLVVSDGKASFYLDNIDQPLTYTLPTTYDGGYIYLAVNEQGGGFDNLTITDLDKKAITLTDVAGTPAKRVIDRSKGEVLSLPTLVEMLDADGYLYKVPVSEWNSDTYRSAKDGVHDFTATFGTLHNLTVQDGVVATMQVENKINGEYDTEKSVKYYFDHPNDFKDFYSQWSETNYQGKRNYFSAYEGDLITADATQNWMIKNGRVMNTYTRTTGRGATGKASYLSTLVLKDLNLTNYRVEMDFTHGGGLWYSYMLLGVQNPNKHFGQVNWGNGYSFEMPSSNITTEYHPEWGGGVYAYLEQEGYFNFEGALAVDNVYRYKYDINTNFVSTYDKTKQHHMTIEVINGAMRMQVDDSDVYYLEMSEEALGGFVGFGAHGTGGDFDNFKVTALDANGNEVPLATAERSMATEAVETIFEPWNPAKKEWIFEWGKEYEQ